VLLQRLGKVGWHFVIVCRARLGRREWESRAAALLGVQGIGRGDRVLDVRVGDRARMGMVLEAGRSSSLMAAGQLCSPDPVPADGSFRGSEDWIVDPHVGGVKVIAG